MSIVIHANPLGNDRNTGHSTDVDAADYRGPVRSIGAAFHKIRVARSAQRNAGLPPAPATILLAEGTYPITQKLSLNAPSASNITVQAATQGTAFIDAGTRVRGFSKTKFFGRDVYVADVAILLKHAGTFRQLFVNGQRRQVARTEELEMVGLSESHTLNGTQVYGVKLKPGRLPKLSQAHTADAIIPNLFSANRIAVEQYHAEEALLILTRPIEKSRLSTEFLQPFLWLEHVLEELKAPGDWCCDREAGKLYYLPLPGEDPNHADVVVTTLPTLLTANGTSEHPLESLRFSGVGFRYANWEPVHKTAQSDPYVPPTIELTHARFCGFWDCTFEHFGNYAVKFGEGSKHCSAVGCTFSDIGGGGVILDGGRVDSPSVTWSEGHRITDNEFSALGRIFIASSAILAMHAARNRITHNRISDLYYTAISVGWTWGFTPQVTADNRIEHNHIFNLGQGVLSDLAGIYTLGVQPGTTIRHNLIHDVARRNYGGFGINLDEGSSHIVIEHNIIYNISSQCLHQHFGRENSIRYNLFAYGGEGLIALSRGNRMNWPEKGGFDDGSITNAFSFHNNILLSAGQGMFIGGLGDESGSMAHPDFISDHNLYWDEKGTPFFGDGVHGAGGRETMTLLLELPKWQALGRDTFGHVQNPHFRDAKSGDFALADGTQLPPGLRVPSLKVGPRPPEERRLDEKEPVLVARFAYG
ncbi:MAG: right-handed parallel beta-helix repeat-containing protein [Polyangiaceae bacterium]|nr:right-handed parallel beta-helix repeat-containing protein [Polyangiaceae bacterium]